MAIRKRWFVLGFLVVALCWGGYSIKRADERGRILYSPFSDHPLKYENLGPSYYFRFLFRGTADGRPVALDQLVECRPFLASGGIGGGTYKMYQRIPERAEIALADGSTLYFRTPDYCRFGSEAKRRKFWQPDKPVPVIPLTYWADNAEKPQAIESYVTPEYFTHADARVRIVESRVTFMPDGFQPAEKPVIDARRTQSSGFGGLGSIGLGGLGVGLLPLPPEVREETLGELLSTSPSGRIAAFRMSQTAAEQDSARNGPLTHYLNTVKVGTPLDLPGVLLVYPERIEPVHKGRDIAGELIPMSWDGQGYEVVEGRPPGLLYLYPGMGVWKKLDRGEPIVVVFRGERIVLQTTTGFSDIALCDREKVGCYKIGQRG